MCPTEELYLQNNFSLSRKQISHSSHLMENKLRTIFRVISSSLAPGVSSVSVGATTCCGSVYWHRYSGFQSVGNVLTSQQSAGNNSPEKVSCRGRRVHISCIRKKKKKINEDGGGAAQTETNPSNSRLSAAVRRAFCSLERAMAPRMLLT